LHTYADGKIQMDTHKKIREHISTLSDGALSNSDLELALAALQSADGQQAWNTYHRIGDALRAQATPELSDAFADKLAARLALEPAPARRAARAADEKRVGDDSGALQGSNGSAGSEQKVLEPLAAVARAKPAIASVS
jgi:sigma-E factor negative regulatory protein RseA